jgi:ABC-2 type transport system permease protein
MRRVRKIWVVVRREFLERVRNKWFVIATVLGPVLMAVAIFLPVYLMTKTAGGRTIVVVDVTTSGFGARLVEVMESVKTVTASELAVSVAQLDAAADSLARRVGEKQLDGFLIVTDATVSDGTVEYRGANVSSQTDMAILRRFVQEAVLTVRLERVGVDPALVAEARIPVDFKTVNIRGGEVTDQSGEATFALAYVMWFILYFAMIVYGTQVMGAVVEEKTSRIVEVLVSSLRPFQLLAGKVIGVGAVGLLQLLIWAVVARLLLGQQELIARMMGIESSGEVFAMPEVPLATIVILLLYFVLGFFLYSTMFAAVGAMSNSEAEARQAQTPVVMAIVIPALMAFGALSDPDGGLALWLTLIPFSSPIAMPVRWAAAAVRLSELALSVAFLIAAAVIVTWIAARIYRVGILAYGKRPGLRELIRWMRA